MIKTNLLEFAQRRNMKKLAIWPMDSWKRWVSGLL